MDEDSGVTMDDEEAVRKKNDQFVVDLTKWADEDTDAVLELIERMAGKSYVGKKEQMLIRKFLSNHVDLVAVLTASLSNQRALVNQLQETRDLLKRSNEANEEIIRLMMKFLPPDIRDGMDKIK